MDTDTGVKERKSREKKERLSLMVVKRKKTVLTNNGLAYRPMRRTYNIIPPLSSLSVQVDRCATVSLADHLRTRQFVPEHEQFYMPDPRFQHPCPPSSSHIVQ